MISKPAEANSPSRQAETIPFGNQTSQRRGLGGFVAAFVLTSLYVTCFFVQPPPSLGQPLRKVLGTPRGWVTTCVDKAYGVIGIETPSSRWIRHAGFLVITSAVLPWLVMAALRRGRPRDLGLRLPNAIAWRVLLVGYLAALPFQVWMVRSSDLVHYYGRQLQDAGAFVFLGYYVVNMLTEHFLFHGFMLGAFRPGFRWPEPAPVRQSARNALTRGLQWLGLAQPVEGVGGLKGVTRWIGLRDGCVPAILASSLLFGAVHLSKDPRELLLSVPGGIALAYLAYRTNSWLVPFALHLATAGTAFLMMTAAPSFA